MRRSGCSRWAGTVIVVARPNAMQSGHHRLRGAGPLQLAAGARRAVLGAAVPEGGGGQDDPHPRRRASDRPRARGSTARTFVTGPYFDDRQAAVPAGREARRGGRLRGADRGGVRGARRQGDLRARCFPSRPVASARRSRPRIVDAARQMVSTSDPETPPHWAGASRCPGWSRSRRKSRKRPRPLRRRGAGAGRARAPGDARRLPAALHGRRADVRGGRAGRAHAPRLRRRTRRPGAGPRRDERGGDRPSSRPRAAATRWWSGPTSGCSGGSSAS